MSEGRATGDVDAARRAAEEIVDAFGRHDTQRYFDAFAEDADFVFHTESRVLRSRAQYRDLWASWEADGFRVLGCRSSDAAVRLLTPDVAVFTHAVRTTVEGMDGPQFERETIVLRREPDGRWLGVHEHLSADPGGGGAGAS